MSFRALPLLRLLVFFIAGIFTANLVVYRPVWLITTGCSFVVLVILWLSFNWFRGWYPSRLIVGFLVLMAVFIAGWMITWRYQSTHMSDPLSGCSDPDRWVARVVSLPGHRTNSIRLAARLEYVLTDSGGFSAETGILLYLPVTSDSIPNVGDRIVGFGFLRPVPAPLNPGAFDYKSYLRRQGVMRQVWLTEGNVKVLKQKACRDVFYYAELVRQRLLNVLYRAGYEPDVNAVASAILLGYDDLLDAELRQTYTGSGAMHVLCVSGLHVGIFYAMFAALLFPFARTRRGEVIKTIILLVLIWGYACITGLSASVSRSATMFTFVCIGGGFKRRTSVLNSLTASAFFLLSINPYFLFEAGFQLSFAAVAGIVTFQPVLAQWCYTGNKVLAYCRDLFTVSIAAQLFTVPIILFGFHQFPNYFILSNLIVIPLSYLVLVTGMATLLLSWIPLVGSLIARLLGFLISLMNDGVSFIENLPGSVTHATIFGLPESILLWLAVFGIFFWVVMSRKQGLVISLISLIIMIVSIHYQEISYSKQHVLVVADGGKHLLFGEIAGRQAKWFGSSSAPPVWTLKGMNQHYAVRPEYSAYQCIVTGMDSLESHFIVRASKRIVVIDSTFVIPKGDSKLAAELVLIGQRPRVRPEWVLDRIEGATWVIGNSLSAYRRKQWEEACRSSRANYYRIDSLGALEITLH